MKNRDLSGKILILSFFFSLFSMLMVMNKGPVSQVLAAITRSPATWQKSNKITFLKEPEKFTKTEKTVKSDQAYKVSDGEQDEYNKINSLISANSNFQKKLDRFEKKYPKSPNVERLYYEAVMHFYYYEREKNMEKWCRVYFEKFPEGVNYDTVLDYYHYAKNMYMELYTQSSFTPKEDASVYCSIQNIPSLDIEIYSVDVKKVNSPLQQMNPYSFPLTRENLVKKIKKEIPEKYFYGSISLGRLEPGLYVVQARSKDMLSATILSVSKLGVISKSDREKTLFFIVDKITGEPVKDAKIKVYEGEYLVARGDTDRDGVAVMEKTNSGSYRYFDCIAVKDNDLAFIYIYQYGSGNGRNLKSYFYADRPVYRPDQTVNFKLVLREKLQTLNYVLPHGKVFKVVIQTPTSKKIYEKELEVNEYGAAADSLKLEPKAELGWYQFIVYDKDGNQVSGYDYYYYNENANHAFRVEEYKKPEFRMSVTPARISYVKGDEAQVDVEVKYYFGQPVKKGLVEYRIEYNQYSLPYWYYYPYSWYYWDEDYSGRRGYGRYSEFFMEGKAETDEKGRCRIIFKTKDLPYDSSYSVSIKVTDKSRRMIEGSTSIRVSQAGFGINLTTDNYMYKPGQKVLINYSGQDIEGKPYAFEGEMTITLYEYKYRKDRYQESYKQVLKEKIRTEPNGKGVYAFVPDEKGNYYVKIKAKDKKGREVTTERNIYVADYSWDSHYNYSSINMLFNKDQYEIGDEATVMIQSPYSKTYALITYEAESLINYQVVKLNSSSAVLDMAMTEDLAPNFYYMVTIIKDNKINNQSKNVIVLPRKKFLNVQIIPDKEVYGPGEQAQFKIKVTDSRNKPVRAELSMGLVDASLYYIQEEFVQDIQQFFYSRVYDYVNTANSFYTYFYGRKKAVNKSKLASGAMAEDERSADLARSESAPAAEAKKSAKDDGSRDGKLKEPEIREYFPDTAFWSAFIRTDGEGLAVIKIKMPDTLTTWRATVRVLTKDTRVGSLKKETITFKNLLCRLEIPRFITQDDRLTISGIVHNYLKSDKEVRSELNVSGVEMTTKVNQSRTITSGGDYRFDWKVQATRAGTAEFLLKSLTDEESDAMKLKIPVLAHGLRRNSIQSAIIKGEKESIVKTIDLPESAIMETTDMDLLASASIASAMLDSLEYLIGYPYGCVEQTMSRFLPDVIVAQSIQKLGLEKPQILKQLPDMVEKGLKRLYELQHGDGGWGWWTNDETHAYMTAYVLYGLSIARQADFKVEENVYENGARALMNLFGKEKAGDQKAYMAYAISYLPQPDKKSIVKLYESRTNLTVYGRSLLAMALIRIGEKKKAGQLITRIKEKADEGDLFCYFTGEGFHYSWERNDVETTSYALKAMVMYDTEDPLIAKTINWLLTKRDGTYWSSTKDTANVVYAFAEYLDRTGELKADYRYSVKVNQKEVLDSAVNPGNVLDSKSKITLPASSLKKGANTVEITKTGKGRLYVTLALHYFNYEKVIKAESKHIKVQRKYEVVKKIKNKEGVVVKEELQPLNEVVNSGEEIEVTLTLDAKSPLQYIMIEDYIPAGCEIVDRESVKNWWTHNEFRDEKAVFFITHYYWYREDTSRVIKYRLRAEIPGDYEALPCIASSMYFPEVYANTASDSITILERSGKK
ncbi:MAG: alpha-2-macroglobulin family protein [bacterium]|nr:alpha-2-macroglobulin family protein [bacterium]